MMLAQDSLQAGGVADLRPPLNLVRVALEADAVPPVHQLMVFPHPQLQTR